MFLIILWFACITSVPVYWLNLDSMQNRNLSNHLGSIGIKYHKRVSALTPKTCNLMMVDSSCNRVGIIDIAIVCSHVSAMYTALNDQAPMARSSKYFMLLEDDVRFKFDIDFDALIASAPRDFGSIQLMISHKTYIENYWSTFMNSNELFVERTRNSTVWSAQAVIYNKEVIRAFVESAVVRDRNGKLGYKLVNTFDYHKTSSSKVNPFKPAIASECLFADMFVYAMAQPSYIFTIPLLNSAITGVNSSFHQAHVAYHVQGYAKIQQIQNDIVGQLESKNGKIPTYIKKPQTVLPEKIVDWSVVAKKNPVVGKGIPKRFNNNG